MIFLAVFLGFVAENIREGVVENHREKQFMESILEDLKNDTARCNRNMASNITITTGMDSLRNCMDNFINGSNNTIT